MTSATPPRRRSGRLHIPPQRNSDEGFDYDYKDSEEADGESDDWLAPVGGDPFDRPKDNFNVGDQSVWYRIIRSVTRKGLGEAVDLKLDKVTKQCVDKLQAETGEFWVDFPPSSCNVIARNMQNAAVNMMIKVFHRTIERFVARVIDLEVFRFRAETENATDELKALPKYKEKYSRATFVRKASAMLIDPDENATAPEYDAHEEQNVNEDIGDKVMEILNATRTEWRETFLKQLNEDDKKGTEVRKGKINQLAKVEDIIKKGPKRGQTVELYKGVMTWTK